MFENLFDGQENQEVKKLVIVSDEDKREYAQYLMQLISSNDDKEDHIVGVKDGSVKSVYWNIKEYKDSESSITSKEKVLFIGNSKLIKETCAHIDIKFDKYGMKYGWLGNRAWINVETKSFNEKELEELIEYAIKYMKSVKIDKLIKNDKLNNFVDKFSWLIPGPYMIYKTASEIKKHVEVTKLQNSLLTVIFYLEGIQKFLEE